MPLATVRVSQVNVAGEAAALPDRVPLTNSWMLFTPTLSDATTVTDVIPESVLPADGDSIVTIGDVVSFCDSDTLTALDVPTFPAASKALATREAGPLRGSGCPR